MFGKIIFLMKLAVFIIFGFIIRETLQQEANVEDNLVSNNTEIENLSNSTITNETAQNTTNDNMKTYKELVKENKKKERLSNFYSKVVTMFSDNKLNASLDEDGDNLRTLTLKPIRVGDSVFEIPANHTISSFDQYFPYFDLSDEILKEMNKETTVINEETVNLIKLILNVNYVRYFIHKDKENRIEKDGNSRFFSVYFKNLPVNSDYVPFWEEENIMFAERIRPNSRLMSHFKMNLTSVFDFFSKLRSKVKTKSKSINKEVLSKLKVFDSINLVATRTFAITLKGWKVINKLTNKIDVKDIENYGFILIPGADAINHESVNYFTQSYANQISNRVVKEPSLLRKIDENNIIKTNLEYMTGKIVIKAGRDFDANTEFLLNYDHVSGVLDLFRRIGYVSLDGIANTNLIEKNSLPKLANAIYRHDWVDLSRLNKNAKLLCLSLGACKGNPEDNSFLTTQFTNSFDKSRLNIYRIINIDYNITENNVHETFETIEREKLPEKIESMALSDFIKDYYKSIVYSLNYRASIEDLIKIYNMSLKKVSFHDITVYQGYTGIKYNFEAETPDNHRRLRETIKLFLIDQHITTMNTQEGLDRLNNVIESSWLNLRSKILSRK